MTKVIINKDQLEKLLEVIGNDCPAEILNKEIPWCCEEYCINCEEYDCIKKWLGVKELPQRQSTYGTGCPYSNDYMRGFNDCLKEIEGDEK